MRALVMDFAADKKVWDIKDQYMFGKSILVAPIVNAQYTQEKLVKLKEMMVGIRIMFRSLRIKLR